MSTSPTGGPRPSPVVIFVHGGAYVGGDKSYYGNVTTWFARQGRAGVNATYRLAPSAKWPAATEDIAGMVKWTRENATRIWRRSHRIVLIGHSAGATHVANYLFNKGLQPSGGPGVAGTVLISGRYRLSYDPADPTERPCRPISVRRPRLTLIARPSPTSRTAPASRCSRSLPNTSLPASTSWEPSSWQGYARAMPAVRASRACRSTITAPRCFPSTRRTSSSAARSWSSWNAAAVNFRVPGLPSVAWDTMCAPLR